MKVVEQLHTRSNWQTVCRWEKQADPRVGKLSTPESLGCVYAPSQAADGFCGQILRSIDARSADLENGRNLFMKKGRGVDDSIYRVCIPPPASLTSPCLPLPHRFTVACYGDRQCTRLSTLICASCDWLISRICCYSSGGCVTGFVACRDTSITSGARRGSAWLFILAHACDELSLSSG